MHAEIRCTYRLQLTPDFGFRRAAEIVPYLADLGVTHCYLSPVLQAAPGSQHGYDATDPTRVSEDLGGEAALIELFAALRVAGMGAVIDIVPNHLAAVQENPWWWDVLKRGQASAHARAFDICWDPPERELQGRILLPVLGDHLGKVLERGEISITRDDSGNPVVAYFDHRFPINDECAADPVRDIGELLDRQFYRLAYWRVGPDETDYRRFFNISTLVGVRVGDPAVFDETHAKIFELMEKGPVDGLRIDHPDGLRDPAGYFHKLRAAAGERWLVAEKILEPGEALPADWPIDGTTGYDFLQRAGGLYIDPTGELPLTEFREQFTGESESYKDLVRAKKLAVLARSFDGDLDRLAGLMRDVCVHPPFRLDYSKRVLRELLAEVLAAFPIYRTYVDSVTGNASPADREAIRIALAAARGQDRELIDFLERILSGSYHENPRAAEFVARFQQLSAPVMAKGVEDAAFYCYDLLLALNEVGCDPAKFAVSPREFHDSSAAAGRDWPRGMLATSTHDTKRGEDVRARISLLSEMPAEWAVRVRRWSVHNQLAWRGREPDRVAEHMLYQTLAGAWPISLERVSAYMKKACREARTHTSWARPDEAYETGIREFASAILADRKFVEMLEEFVAPLVQLGRVNSLSQTLLKLTAPGVPDIYQGCELWDDSLVDPDNRRPVDFKLRAELLRELNSGLELETIMRRGGEGLPKLYLIRRCLEIRKRMPRDFAGSYLPLAATGAKADHVIAYIRGGNVAVVAPRLIHGVGGDWKDTSVEFRGGLWRNAFDNSECRGNVTAADLFRRFPVALLTRSQDP